MRLLPVLFLSLLLVPPGRAGTPPSDHPTAWLPQEGSAWMSVQTPDDEITGFTFGMRPIRALTANIRQGDWGAQADFALELLQGRGAMPTLVLDSRGHGASRTERLDSLLLGGGLGDAEATAGLARDGGGDFHPVLHLRLPVALPGRRQGWLSAGWGGPDGPSLEASWSVKPDTLVSVGWRRDRGFIAGSTLQFAGAAFSRPRWGRERRPDGAASTDIGPGQSPGAAFYAALPLGDPAPARVVVESHRLGLPGVRANLSGADIDALRAHRSSPAELRRNALFSRADTPDSLARHWELQLDAMSEIEPGPRGVPWAGRVSAGALLHLLPWPGLIVSGAGRAAAAGTIPWPRWYPPSPGRDDAALYLQRTYSLDRAQIAYVRALSPSLDMLVEVGHLEAMYGGAGGELRYQPVKARWSLGLSAHQVWKRPPTVQTLYRGTGRVTGFLTGGWEGQDGGTRSELAVGRYLAGDWGGTYSLSRRFGTGVELALDATATLRTSRLGLSLTVPLASLGGHVDMAARVRIRPLAREYAERLDRVLSLSDLRFAAGFGRVSRDWDQGLR